MLDLFGAVAARALGAVYRMMAQLWSAGIPPVQAAATLEMERSEAARAFARAWRERKSLAQAARHARSVPRFHAPMLAVAEESGTLDRVLQQLAEACATDASFRMETVHRLLPSLAIFVAFAIFVPAPLLVTHGFGGWLAAALLLLAPVVLAVLALRRIFADLGDGQGLLARLPGVRDLVWRAALERSWRVIGLANGAGLPLPRSLEAAAQAGGSIGAAFESVRRRVDRGGSLAQEMIAAEVAPGFLAALATEGETTGRLDSAFGRGAAMMRDDLRQTIAWRVRLLGIGAYCTAMGVVAWRVISFYARTMRVPDIG